MVKAAVSEPSDCIKMYIESWNIAVYKPYFKYFDSTLNLIKCDVQR
jgi:hypothetical protein